MIKEYSFSFNELVIDRGEIAAVLGYTNSLLPAPFDLYLEEALTDALNLNDIRATFRLIENVVVDWKEGVLMAAEHEFKIGKTVCNELKGSDRMAFFVCSAGKIISEKSINLLKGEDPIRGYIYDVLGSAIAEATGNLMQSYLKQEILEDGEGVTNRYSPGYCHWSIAEQHKLFSLFGEVPSGVSLTPSALMNPVKSISGVIGIGKGVKFRNYQCTLCWNENCVYRRIRKINHKS